MEQQRLKSIKRTFVQDKESLFVDDLLATGGTAKAAIDLIEELGGVVVKVLFVMELEGLHGRDVLKGYDVESVITYPEK